MAPHLALGTATAILVILATSPHPQDYSQYRGMTANLHMLVAHIPDWVG